jgi:membrane associated rhomboid family serine protease
MARSPSIIDRFSFGGRVPAGVGLVLALTVVTSLVVAFGERHALELFELSTLAPALVFRGQVWRIVTWVLIEPSPLALLFRGLLLYWLGRDLSAIWGSRRFLSVYFGTVVFAAVVTSLLALVDASIMRQVYTGSWALDAALTVAWGLAFPDRVIRIYFVIPVRGLVIAWGTVALSVAYAIFSGWERYMPVLAAEASMLAWVHRGHLQARWRGLRRASLEKKRQRVSHARARKREASGATLRLIESKDDDFEPLTAEEEEALKRALGRTKPPRPTDLN